MQITYDLHTHTTYSHGSGSILDNARAAKARGLKGIGITDHGFCHHAFPMHRNLLDKMRAECDEAERETGVKILLGIESNLTGLSGKCDLAPADYEKLDLFLAGVHRFIKYDSFADFQRMFVRTGFRASFKLKPPASLVDYTTKLYINCIKNNPLDVLTHINYLCFSRAREVAECCADCGTLLEINTKKTHLSDDEWDAVLKTDVRFVVNSDAHSPERVGDAKLFDDLSARIKIPAERIVNAGDRLPEMRFAEFKKKL